MMLFKVEHDEAQRKFFVIVEGQECAMHYRLHGDKQLEYYKTFTPDELRGRGFAAQVVQYALDYAKKNQLKVLPSCSYVRSFIEKNSQYQSLLS